MAEKLTAPGSLILRQIEATDRANKLSLGGSEFTPLKSFLKNHALKFHKSNIARTFVLVPPDEEAPRIWGYITLMCSEITLADVYSLDDCIEANRYKTYPAIKIARLAIDTEIRGNNYGRALIDWGVTVTKNSIMPNVGCRFLCQFSPI